MSGQGLESVARQGGEAYEVLLQRIDNLRRMANARYESYVVDDLCGLSLQALRETRLGVQEQREAKRLKELAAAAAARRRYLETDARQELREEAAEWLHSPSPNPSRQFLSGRVRTMASSNLQSVSSVKCPLRPLEDEADVAELRRQMGLEPVENNARGMDQLYGPCPTV